MSGPKLTQTEPYPLAARCEKCRTINLALRQLTAPKPDMKIMDKCSQPPRFNCCSPAQCITEAPINPTCIKVCSKEEYVRRKAGIKSIKELPKPLPPYTHGKFMWLVKAATLAGTVYFTKKQGVWGDQQDVLECAYRWKEYFRSFTTRRPPSFDECGRVIRSDPCNPPVKGSSIVAPFYNTYKAFVTTLFSGIVKVPVLLKCAYLDYLKAMEQKWKDLQRERQLRKHN